MSKREPASDIVVIGGGIIGTSIAWRLTQRGVSNVTLLERATMSAGATGKTGALLRQHYSNEPEALLAHQSLQVFRNWSDVVGGDCGYVPSGLIVTVDTAGELAVNVERMRRNIEMQNRLGIDARLITAAELAELQPVARVDDLTVAAYEPASGYVDAIAANRSMAAAAVRGGATIRENSAVLKVCTTGNRVVGVETAGGFVPAGAVVCAAGPWSTALLAACGVSLPITALRVQIAIVQRPRELEVPHFVFIDTAAGMFTRPWGPGRSLIGVGSGDQHDEVDPDDYDPRNDLTYPQLAIAAAARRIPAMAGASYLHGHAGLYDMTPDAHPVIGHTPVTGLYVAAGFSGAGFKKGPAVGQRLAELILDGRSTSVDLEPFRLDRFNSDAWREPWSENEYLFSSDFGHKF